jgi:hypothetical protein
MGKSVRMLSKHTSPQKNDATVGRESSFLKEKIVHAPVAHRSAIDPRTQYAGVDVACKALER